MKKMVKLLCWPWSLVFFLPSDLFLCERLQTTDMCGKAGGQHGWARMVRDAGKYPSVVDGFYISERTGYDPGVLDNWVLGFWDF